MKCTLRPVMPLLLACLLVSGSAAAEMAAQLLLSEGRVDVAIADLREQAKRGLERRAIGGAGLVGHS